MFKNYPGRLFGPFKNSAFSLPFARRMYTGKLLVLFLLFLGTQVAAIAQCDVTVNVPAQSCINQPFTITFSNTVGSPVFPIIVDYTVGGVAQPSFSMGASPAALNFTPTAAGNLTVTITGAQDSDGTPVICSTVNPSATTNVNALPTVTALTPPADACVDDADQTAIAGGATPTGGTYSGPGVSGSTGTTYDFSPASAGVGTHTITYTYTDGNGCQNTTTGTVQVFALPTLSALNPPVDACVDAADQIAIAGGVTPAGGTYSGPGVTGSTGTTYNFSPSTAGVGVHIITYTYTDGNGCENTTTATVEVFALPTLTALTPPADACLDGATQTAVVGGVTPTGGVYSGPGVGDDGNGSSYAFTPITAGVGVHTITYTYTDGNGCENTITGTVEVFALPVITFVALGDLCVDAGIQTGLTGGSATPIGGTGIYSGPGVTDNGGTYSFNPAAAGVGVHTITYTYTDLNGCVNSGTDDVEVFALPTVALTAPADLCVNVGVQTGLTGGSPAQGTSPGDIGAYSGPGVTNGGTNFSFDPAIAGVGTHIITYTYTDGNGCVSSSTDNIEVFALPVLSGALVTPADLCVDDAERIGVAGGVTPVGGVYSGAGVTDTGNGLTYNFDPAVAGAGTITVTYTYTDGNGCIVTTTGTVEVIPLPVLSALTTPSDACINALDETGIVGGVTPTGGTYSGPGVSGSTGTTYDFSPSTAGVGVHTITYSYTDPLTGCENTTTGTVEVFALPTVNMTAPADLCLDAGVQTGLGGGTPAQGTTLGDIGLYVGSGVTDDGNGMTYSLDPAAAGVGIKSISYIYTDGNGCSVLASDNIEIFALPVLTGVLNTPADLCVDELEITGIAGGITPVGGVYSGPGVTDAGDGLTYDFDPAVAGAGLITITYTFTDGNGCSETSTGTVEVLALPVLTALTPANDGCLDAGIQAGIAGGVTPAGGTYSGPGVTDAADGLTYDFDPAAAGVGTHTITYSYTDPVSGCANTTTATVEVFALPIVAFTAPADLCIDAGVQTGLGGGTPPQGTVVGDLGVYSGPGVVDDGNGMTYSFNPAAAGAGVHTLTYSYTSPDNCTISATDDIEVFALPVINFTTPVGFCIDATVQLGLGLGTTTPVGGVYSGLGVTDDGNGLSYQFDPSVAGIGVHNVTYTVTNANGCTNSATSSIEVFALPVLTPIITLSDLCVDEAERIGVPGGVTPAGGVYSGPGITDSGNGTTYNFDPAVAGVGVHTITYTYTDGNGCTNSISNTIEVLALPTLTALTPPADACVDGAAQTGIAGGVTPVGGIYSGPGVTNVGDGATYGFDPATAGVGIQTITYTYTHPITGCENTITGTVEVFALPVVTFTSPADLCIDAGVQSGLGGGLPTGGTYAGPGVIDDGNGTSYSFNPAAAGVGTHTISYTFTDANGCDDIATDNTEVFPIPVVTFTAPADLCLNVGVQAGLGGGLPAGGTYAGPGVTDDGNGTSYSFDPIAAGVGVHTITYTFADGNGCDETGSDDIEVFAIPVVTFTAPADLCTDAGVQVGLGGGLPTGGTYAGPGVTDDGNGTSYSFDPAAAGAGIHTISYTFTDANACVVSASDDIEVILDATPPVPDVATLPDVTAECLVSTLTPPTATDFCSGTITGTSPSTALLPFTTVGTVTVTWTYDDGNGNTSSQTQNVIVTADVTPPVPDVAVLPDVTGECLVANLIDPSATDLCSGTVTVTNDATLPITTVGTTVVTWTYDDGNGNTSTQPQNIIVTPDVTPPVPDVPVLADVNSECAVTSLPLPSATDFCSGTVSISNDAVFPISALGTTIVTWSYNDGNGNISTQPQNVVIVADATPPVPDVATLLDVTDECSVTTLVEPTATDNCGGAVIVTNDATLPITTQGTTVVTWTYDDGNGNTSSQTQNVVINDNTPPVPDVATLPDVTDECSVTALVPPTATDNCGGSVLVSNDATLPITFQGTTVVTWTYDDGNGNTSTQTQNVVIDDVSAPVPNVANLPDVTAQCSVTSLTAPTATDLCVGSVLVTSDAVLPITTQGTTVVTWTYDDGNGNTVTQPQNVIIDDVSAPVPDVATLPDVTGECNATISVTPTATDNCIGAVTATTTDPLTYSTQGTFTVTWTYDDGNGNTSTQTQTVIINDNTPPLANVTTLLTETGECSVTLTAPTATDNCEGTITATTTDPTTYNTEGTFTVTWTYDDGNGNTSSQPQTVIVDDITAPVPDVVTLADATDECSVTLTAPTATDNCVGSITATTTDPLTYNTPGTSVVTWTYDDGNGNTSTQNQTVIIDDVTNPVAICQNVTVQLDAAGNASVTAAEVNNGSTDNCGIASLALDITSFTCAELGANTVTLTVTDTDGNIATCTATVTVEDNIPPVITCPLDILVTSNDPGQCGAVVTYALPTVTDNCGIITTPTLSAGLASGSLFPVGVTVVSYEFTDQGGNTETCSFNVTVEDDEDPVITCPTNVVVSASPGQCGAIVNYPGVSATDNCSPILISLTSGIGNGNFFPVGTTTETYSATDPAGNSVTCSFTVTVEDNEVPVLTCPADIVVDNDPGQCGAVVSYALPTISDNCPPTGLPTLTTGLASGSVFPLGTTPITYTYTDLGGNIVSCSFNVTVDDNEGPVISCPTDITVTADPITCDAVVNYPGITATDNCPGAVTVSLTGGLSSGSTFPVGTTAVSYQASDVEGNISTCSFNVIVLPAVPATQADILMPPLVEVCVGEILSLTANAPGVGETGVWTFGDANAIFVPGNTDPNADLGNLLIPTVSGLPPFPLTWTISNGCATTSETILVQVNALPTGFIVETSPITANGAADGELLAIPQGGNPPYNGYQWNDPLLQTTSLATGLTSDTYEVVITDSKGCESDPISYFLDEPPVVPILVDATVFLQGAYRTATGLMHDSLRVKLAADLINEPYTALGYAPVAGFSANTTTAGILATTGNNAPVDWVSLELRDKVDPAIIVGRQSALVLRDGSVVDAADGVSAVKFDLPVDDYYIAIRHRNHLGAMTATALNVTTGAATVVDFTNVATATFGNFAQRVDAGVNMLWGGDANNDKQIQLTGPASDNPPVLNKVFFATGNTLFSVSFTVDEYAVEDLNIDSRIIYTGPLTDVNMLFPNVLLHPGNPGFTEGHIIFEQIP